MGYVYYGDGAELTRAVESAGVPPSAVGEIRQMIPYRRLTSFLGQAGQYHHDPGKAAEVLQAAVNQLRAVKVAAAVAQTLIDQAAEGLGLTVALDGRVRPRREKERA